MSPLAVSLSSSALLMGLAFVMAVGLLMAVGWAAITAVRILLPERPLSLDPVQRRQRATLQGEAVSVRLRDLLEDEAQRHATASRVEPGGPPRRPITHPLFDDLWLRRN